MTSSPTANPLRRAVEAQKAGRLAEAEQQCRRILAAHPRNLDAQRLLAMLLGQLGRPAEGIALLRRALKANPRSAEAHADLGSLLRLSGNAAAAEEAFEAALRIDPDYFVARNNLGLALMDSGRLAEAVACFEAAVARRPNFANGWFNLGLARQAGRDHAKAIAAYRRALAIAPGWLDALCNLGNARFEAGEIAPAIETYRAALTLRPDYVPALRSLAVALDARDDPETIETLRRATVIAPANGELHNLLATMLRRRGRFDEAATCYETAIAEPCRRHASYYGLVHCRKLGPADAPLVAAMEEAAAQPGLSDADRGSVHFALGKTLDDLGRYEQAMRAFDEANRLFAKAGGFDRLRHAALIDGLIAAFDTEGIAALRAAASGSAKPVLIVGMMRSGTTLVEQILASHSRVAAAGELRFWGERMRALDAGAGGALDLRAARSLAADYLAALDRISGDATRVTDKMPHNFLWLGAIHALFPNARIVHCRRNPADVALSIYFTQFGQDHAFAYRRDDIVFFFEQYRRLMAHWRRAVAPDALLEVDYEDLVRNQEKTSRALIEFCGLEWEESCLRPDRARRKIHTASAWQARQPVYATSAERWRNYEPWLGEFRALLAEART